MQGHLLTIHANFTDVECF